MTVPLWLKLKNSFHDKFKAPLRLLTNNLGIFPQRIVDFSESKIRKEFQSEPKQVEFETLLWERHYTFFIENNKILIPFSDLDEHYKKIVLELGQKNCIIQPHPLHYMLLKRC